MPSAAARANRRSESRASESLTQILALLPKKPQSYLIKAVRVSCSQRIERRSCLSSVFPLLTALHSLGRLPLLDRLRPLQSIWSASGYRCPRAGGYGTLALGIVHFPPNVAAWTRSDVDPKNEVAESLGTWIVSSASSSTRWHTRHAEQMSIWALPNLSRVYWAHGADAAMDDV